MPTGLNLAALQPLIALWYAPQVTIVLNRQVPEGVISCSATPAGCTFTPTGVKVEAIAVELHRVSLGGQLVSGTIVLGGQSAEQ